MSKISESASQTPPPADTGEHVNIKDAYKIVEQHYKHIDTVNNGNYRYGTMLEKSITDDHKVVLKSLIYMLINDMKACSDETLLVDDIEKKCRLIISMIDLLPDMSKNTTVNKQILAKSLGYFLKLHEMHY